MLVIKFIIKFSVNNKMILWFNFFTLKKSIPIRQNTHTQKAMGLQWYMMMMITKLIFYEKKLIVIEEERN